MSSPSPGPTLNAVNLCINSGVPSRRVSGNFIGMSGIGSTGTAGLPGGQPPRALTPPVDQQHSPVSFLAGLSSRLISKPRLPDIQDMGGNSFGGTSILGFQRNPNHNFGVVGGSVGGPPNNPPSLDLADFPALGGNITNTVSCF